MWLNSVTVLCLFGSLVSADWGHEEKPKEHHHEHYEHIKNIIVTKKVPKPYPVEVEKHVPYEVKVPVDKPYPVYVPMPYPVYVEKKVPYEVKIPVPKPYVVEKKVPYEVKVQVDKPYPVEVPKPYNVYVEKKVPFIVEKKVPYKVQVPVEKKYPVHYPVEKKIPFPVIKEVPYTVNVPIEKLVPYKVEKPVPFHVEKRVPYPVLKEVPYPVKVPYKVEIKVPYQVEGHKTEGHQVISSLHSGGSGLEGWQQLKSSSESGKHPESQLPSSASHIGSGHSSQFVQLGSLSGAYEHIYGGSAHEHGSSFGLYEGAKTEEQGSFGNVRGHEGHLKLEVEDGWKPSHSGFVGQGYVNQGIGSHQISPAAGTDTGYSKEFSNSHEDFGGYASSKVEKYEKGNSTSIKSSESKSSH